MYQPAGKPSGGTSIVPSPRKPRPISPESTPIAGIRTRTGVDLASGVTPAAGVPALLRAGSAGVRTDGVRTDDGGAGSAAIDGRRVRPHRLEHPVPATAIVTSRTAAPALALDRTGRGRLHPW